MNQIINLPTCLAYVKLRNEKLITFSKEIENSNKGNLAEDLASKISLTDIGLQHTTVSRIPIPLKVKIQFIKMVKTKNGVKDDFWLQKI